MMLSVMFLKNIRSWHMMNFCFCYDMFSVIDILCIFVILYKFIWYFCSTFVINFLLKFSF